MLADNKSLTNLPDSFAIEKNMSIDVVIEFLQSHLTKFNKHCKDSLNLPERKLNYELFVFLEREARMSKPLFLFVQEPIESNNTSPDIGVIAVERYSDSKPFFAIECKILPTPGTGREKEYVQNEVLKKSGNIWECGAIARFKKNLHATGLNNAAIIGYIKKNNFDYWLKSVNDWIMELVSNGSALWSEKDLLNDFKYSEVKCTCVSKHNRLYGESIDLNHFWIMLN